MACVATAPACGAAITAGAVVVGVTATGVIIYVAVDYLIQHPELYEVTYPAGQPQPVPAPAPPQTPPLIGTPPAPPFVSADGTRPISAVPGCEPGGAPAPRPAPRPVPIPQDCRPDDDDFAHKVLTVGDYDFGYSIALSVMRRDLKIVGTSFEEGGSNGQVFRGHYGFNLTIYEDVDAKHLEAGEIGQSQYRAVIFNNPYAGFEGSGTAELIREFKSSARNVLMPGGHIHINVTQELLIDHDDVAIELGLADNRRSRVSNLSTFGPTEYGPGTEYYAPFIPHYSGGAGMNWYRYSPARAAFLKNFRF